VTGVLSEHGLFINMASIVPVAGERELTELHRDKARKRRVDSKA
jgi:hypothetical protein